MDYQGIFDRFADSMLGDVTMATSLVVGGGNLLLGNPNPYVTTLAVGGYIVGAITKHHASREMNRLAGLEMKLRN